MGASLDLLAGLSHLTTNRIIHCEPIRKLRPFARLCLVYRAAQRGPPLHPFAWRAEVRHQMRPGAANAAQIDAVDAELDDGSTWAASATARLWASFPRAACAGRR